MQSRAGRRLAAGTGAAVIRIEDAEARGRRRGPLRVALYSRDTCGRGHLRRSLLVADALAGGQLRTSVLTITGAAEAKLLRAPDGVDCLTVPALGKSADDSYHARSLGVELRDLLELRSHVIEAALATFRPDVFIVDKVARGALGELDRLLADLKRGGRTRLVLGLRDVLDDPNVVRTECIESRFEEAIAEYYDAVWVYGDRRVFDVAAEYGFSGEVGDKLSYVGYLDPTRRSDQQADRLETGLGREGRQLVACMLGGGQDGVRLARAFIDAELPHDTDAVVVTGPFMSERSRRYLARLADDANRRRGGCTLHVAHFLTDPLALLRRAARVVTMGGYNTAYEALSLEKDTLVVPRTTPRREQVIRAERLHRLGLVDMCLPEELSARALSHWLGRPRSQRPRARTSLRFDGLDHVEALVAELACRQPAFQEAATA